MWDGSRKRGNMVMAMTWGVFLLCVLAEIFIPHADISAWALENDAMSTEPLEQKNETKKKKTKLDPSLLKEDADWGTFYDPKEIFCGKYDCYKILGFDYRTFYQNRPSTKEITQNYRGLSRHWHPDKNKAKGAKERFVKIARAYEVLTNKETRDEYDLYRDRPDEYFKKYGSSVLWTYAPKSNTAVVIVGLVALLSWITVWIKKRRWQTVANHMIKAALENWSLREGGSNESIAIREQAMEILDEKQASENENKQGEEEAAKNHKALKKKRSKGLDKKEQKETDQESLKKIITELVEEIDDFGGGFSKPTWKDLFVIKLLFLPYYVMASLLWWTRYLFRRIRKLDYSDEELAYFTRHAVGDIIWDSLPESERKELQKRELWIQDNLIEWKEEEEVKLLSSREQKYYAREKKKEKKAGGKRIKDE